MPPLKRSGSLPHFLPLTAILDPLGDAVGRALDAVCQGLQSVTDRLRSRRVVDGGPETTARASDHAADGTRHPPDRRADLPVSGSDVHGHGGDQMNAGSAYRAGDSRDGTCDAVLIAHGAAVALALEG